MVSAGVFLTHIDSGRVRMHFKRLVEETAGLVNWHYVLNTTPMPQANVALASRSPAELLPARYSAMQEQGALIPGYMDLVTIPAALALDADFVWVVEFDVDWAGHWAELFGEFANDGADLLTTTIRSIAETPGWLHWRTAAAPPWVEREQFRRCYCPIVRISRAFALRYVELVLDARWRGHAEFTLSTSALASGASLADLGPVYENNPLDPSLSPGTLVWRPVRWSYYHEQPSEFPLERKLYHPVKPWTPGCEAPPAQGWRGGLSAARARLRRD